MVNGEAGEGVGKGVEAVGTLSLTRGIGGRQAHALNETFTIGDFPIPQNAQKKLNTNPVGQNITCADTNYN